jgi:AcrR family transcriptional regulator
VAEQRPRDAATTRDRILSAARRHFATAGYDRSTVRAIAADAGVSANLITRYFGGKRGLFRSATDADLHLADHLRGPLADLGLRIATEVVGRWEGEPGDDPLVTMMRAAMSDPSDALYMAEFFRQQAFVPLASHLAGQDSGERAAAVGAFIMGVVVQRYILRAGPSAEASAADVTAWMADVLQLLLVGDPLHRLAAMPDIGGRP